MPAQRRYILWGHAHRISYDDSARRAWMPSRCPLLVLFIVGVSICVASGFSLFVEYDQSNRCPPDSSIAQQNSPASQEGHMLERGEDGVVHGTVFSPTESSNSDSVAPCEEAKISGTLLVKYLFFLLGLCMALCTLSCALILLTQASPGDPSHVWCCCFPVDTACLNRMRAFVGMEPLPEVRPHEDLQQDTLGGPVTVNSTSSRSGCLWSPREVPVLQAVLVQQPHMRRSSDSGSIESLSKTLHGVVVGVPDSSNSTSSWSAHFPFKKQTPSTFPLAQHTNNQPDGPSLGTNAADMPPTGQLQGSIAAVAGSSHRSPLAQEHMHAMHADLDAVHMHALELGHSDTVEAQHEGHANEPEATLGKGSEMGHVREVHSTVTGAYEGGPKPLRASPEEQHSAWAPHQNAMEGCSSLAGGQPLGTRTPVPAYPDLSSTMSGSGTPREHPSSCLDAATKQDESTLPSLFSTATTSSFADATEPAAMHVNGSSVTNSDSHSNQQEPHKPLTVSLNLERPSVSTEPSTEPSMEPSMEPSTVASVEGLASEHTMHDLGAELSTVTESSTGALAPEAGLQDVSAAASPPEMWREGAQRGLEELASRLQMPFEFPKRAERPGQRFHELATPRMNDDLGEPAASADASRSASCSSGDVGSQRAEMEGVGTSTLHHNTATGSVLQHRPHAPPAGTHTDLAVPSGIWSEPSQELGHHSGPLPAMESNLTVESSLPEGMSSESALSGCPSGLSAGYSLQSIIGGAVTRFAE